MYAHFKGEIPKGKQINHTCHNPKCCNPEHLYAGTQQENVDDKYNAGRGIHASGGANGKARKLIVKHYWGTFTFETVKAALEWIGCPKPTFEKRSRNGLLGSEWRKYAIKSIEYA